jgi:hypothetical protein
MTRRGWCERNCFRAQRARSDLEREDTRSLRQTSWSAAVVTLNTLIRTLRQVSRSRLCGKVHERAKPATQKLFPQLFNFVVWHFSFLSSCTFSHRSQPKTKHNEMQYLIRIYRGEHVINVEMWWNIVLLPLFIWLLPKARTSNEERTESNLKLMKWLSDNGAKRSRTETKAPGNVLLCFMLDFFLLSPS